MSACSSEYLGALIASDASKLALGSAAEGPHHQRKMSDLEDDPSDFDENEDEDDSGNASDAGGDVIGLLETEPPGTSGKDGMDIDEEFPFESLTTEQILQDMINCIKEVNTVVQLPPTTTRILLNHFRWDKEKLYERYDS